MKKNRSYSEATHLYGRISTASAILMFLMVPIAISVRYAAWPPFRDVLKGLLGVVPVFWTVGVIEVLTYAPMLGTGGTYLAFVTGSLSSLKCSAPAARWHTRRCVGEAISPACSMP